MSHALFRPVFFLAFANSSDANYLSALQQESKYLNKELWTLDRGEQIRVVREESTDLDDLPELFAKYQDEIFLFHYGGHADGRHLALEDQEAHVMGIKELFKHQRNLKLAFLNGCSTKDQALMYLDAGISAVIATTREIPDEDALIFAVEFYKAMAGFQTVIEAFNKASQVLDKKYSENVPINAERELKFRGIKVEYTRPISSSWQLFVKQEDRDRILNWSIPEKKPGDRRIIVILAQSADYYKKLQQAATLKGQISECDQALLEIWESVKPDRDAYDKKYEKKRSLEKELDQVIKTLEEFKKAALRLAKLFDDSTVYTDRLERAKALFEQGKIREADEVLNAEVLKTEQAELLKEEQQTTKKLITNANSFLKKAHFAIARQIEADALDWYENAESFFQDSLKSYRLFNNVYDYAIFLLDHHRYGEALILFEELLDKKTPLSKVEQADLFSALADTYLSQNKFEQAFSYYRQSLPMLRAIATDQAERHLYALAIILNNLAKFERYQGAEDEAHELYKEASEAVNQLRGINTQLANQISALFHNLKGKRFLHERNFEEASLHLNQALQLFNKLAKEEPQKYLAGVGVVLNNFGLMALHQEKFTKAKEYLLKDLEIKRQLVRNNSQAYNPTLAGTLNNLGNAYQGLQEWENAIKCFEEARQLNGLYVAREPATFLPQLAKLTTNLAVLNSRQGKVEEAKKYYESSIELYRQLAKINPAIFRVKLAKKLGDIAPWYLFKLGDLQTTYNYYTESASIYQELAVNLPQKNRKEYLTNAAKMYENLGLHLSKNGHGEEAIKYYQEAGAILKALIKEAPERLADRALNAYSQGIVYMEINNPEAAQKQYEIAFDIYRDLAKSQHEDHLSALGGTMQNLAEAYQIQGKSVQAEQYYREGLQLYRKLTNKNPQRFLPDLAWQLILMSGFFRTIDPPDRDKSLSCLYECFILLRPILVLCPISLYK